jgi:hypothetical protein
MNKCSIENCNGKQNRIIKGYCHMHWRRQQYGDKNGNKDLGSPYKKGTDNGICVIEGCNNYAGPTGACRKHWHNINKTDKGRNRVLRTKGMTQEEYDLMLEKQEGGCAICGGQDQHQGRSLSIDHDHSCCPGEKTCGKCNRGLLCGQCNRALGLLRDDVNIIQNMLKYLTPTPIDWKD